MSLRILIKAILIVAAVGIFGSPARRIASKHNQSLNRSDGQFTIPKIPQDRLRLAATPYIKPYHFPAILSPDGRLVLFKALTADAFALEIYERNTLRKKLELSADPWELAWAPSGLAIAFLAEIHRGVYGLNIWWPTANKRAVIAGPRIASAAYAFKWSPNGRLVAYLTGEKQNSYLVVVSIQGVTCRVVDLEKGAIPEGGIAWSPDSSRLIFSRHISGATSLSVLDITASSLRSVYSQSDISFRDLTWSPSNTLIGLAARGRTDEYFRLALLTLKGHMRYCPNADGDVESPTWLNGYGRLAYLVERDGHQSLIFAQGCDSERSILHSRFGTMRIQNNGYHYGHPALTLGSTVGPQRLMAIGPDTIADGFRAIHDHLSPLSAQELWLPGAGHPMAAWLWTPPPTRSLERAIVIVHGGPHLHESGSWEPFRHAFQMGGYFVLAPNYGGSTGYGQAYERMAGVDEQAHDLLASVRYLVTRGITPAHITIVASSYGTRVTLRALEIDPGMCGAVVFAPFLATTKNIAKQQSIPFSGLVLAFHGLNDPISTPKAALDELKLVFKNALAHDKLYWRVFDDEAHGFSRIRSLREEYATISCFAAAELCPKP